MRRCKNINERAQGQIRREWRVAEKVCKPKVSVPTFVQRVVGIGLEEEKLQAVHDRVQAEHGLPVLAQDIQTNVPVQVNVGMVNLPPAVRPPGNFFKDLFHH